MTHAFAISTTFKHHSPRPQISFGRAFGSQVGAMGSHLGDQWRGPMRFLRLKILRIGFALRKSIGPRDPSTPQPTHSQVTLQAGPPKSWAPAGILRRCQRSNFLAPLKSRSPKRRNKKSDEGLVAEPTALDGIKKQETQSGKKAVNKFEQHGCARQ